MTQLTPTERAELVRQLLSSRGWTEVQDASVIAKMNQAKDNMILDPADRAPEFKNWDMAKFSGFVFGLGWARSFLPDWLTKWNAEIQAYQAATALPDEPAAHGHPYGKNGAEAVDSGAEVL